eukprot:682385-Rhodomonas_salina.2
MAASMHSSAPINGSASTNGSAPMSPRGGGHLGRGDGTGIGDAELQEPPPAAAHRVPTAEHSADCGYFKLRGWARRSADASGGEGPEVTVGGHGLAEEAEAALRPERVHLHPGCQRERPHNVLLPGPAQSLAVSAPGLEGVSSCGGDREGEDRVEGEEAQAPHHLRAVLQDHVTLLRTATACLEIVKRRRAWLLVLMRLAGSRRREEEGAHLAGRSGCCCSERSA